VREAIFNILGQQLNGERVLDLYAGTGALALEALSRGAREALLVDQAPEACTLATRNAAALGFSDRIVLWRLPVAKALGRLAAERRTFELIFADPPYDLHDGQAVLAGVVGNGLLLEGGLLVLEHDKRESLPETAGPWARVDQRAYGDTRVSFFQASTPPKP
jgi:16S rRNA (guanine(966)-N(2))-methyltransferase RsmD